MNLNILNAFAVSVTRLGAGLNASNSGDHTDLQPLEYYEFEACPFCRKVREAMSELNLNAMVYPCPKGGQRYRESLEQLAGKQQFPYLIDPNTFQILLVLARELNDQSRDLTWSSIPESMARQMSGGDFTRSLGVDAA